MQVLGSIPAQLAVRFRGVQYERTPHRDPFRAPLVASVMSYRYLNLGYSHTTVATVPRLYNRLSTILGAAGP